MYNGYFFDLDGVAYLGTKVIESCKVFVNQLIDDGIQVAFLTNNSSRDPETVAKHLSHMGYHVTAENIITSSMVTAHYLKEQEKKRVFMIGMHGLYEQLTHIGCELVNEDADYVVVGLDLDLTFEKLATASKEIYKGATFISTNGDIKLATADGIVPGNGSFTKALELATGVEPLFMGKPEITMFDFGLERLGLTKEEVVMVGDNYYTDILGAHKFGIDSIFVETGIMTKEEMLEFPNQPTHIVKDLSFFNRNK